VSLLKDMIGIVGGMGSHATVSMFRQLINHSPAKTDQEYMEVLIHNNTCIPDRTQGLLYNGSDPLPEMIRSVKLLEQCGATIIVLACITAHNYYDQLAESLEKARLFHVVKETADYACHTYPHVKKVGVLATEGSLKTNLWKNEFNHRDIDTLMLSDHDQMEYFNNVIYGSKGIKAGYQGDHLKSKLLEGCNQLREMGAEVIIGACSELPLLISQRDLHIPYIDSMQVAVKKLIEQYYRHTSITNEPILPPFSRE